MGEHIADQCHDRAQCHLPADAISGAVHLQEKRNGDHRADGAANRRENDVVETERVKNIAARHHQKTAEPRTCELFGSRAAKAAANPQLIRREPVRFIVVIPPPSLSTWVAVRACAGPSATNKQPATMQLHVAAIARAAPWVHDCTRECLALIADTSISGSRAPLLCGRSRGRGGRAAQSSPSKHTNTAFGVCVAP